MVKKHLGIYVTTLFNTSALREIGGLKSLHNVLEDCYAITKLSSRCDWLDIEDIKASFRKYPEQKNVFNIYKQLVRGLFRTT